MDERTERRPNARSRSAAALALAVLVACDRKPVPTPEPGPSHPAVRTIPDPIVDPAAQKLDAGLGAAYKLLQAGRFDAARDAASEYVRNAGPAARGGQAEFVVGMTYQRQMLYAAASEHFLRALELEPGFLATYYQAGLALFNVGRLMEARAAFAVFERAHPGDAATAFGQGLVEFEDDHVDLAERYIRSAIESATKQRALAQDPREIDADLGRYHARLGDVYVRRDDMQHAKEMFEKAAALRGESPEIWSKLASACERLGDTAGAAAARRKYDETTAQRASRAGNPR